MQLIVYFCSISLKQGAGITVMLEYQLEESAFRKCSVIIVDKLDISEILSHLISHELLAKGDLQTLLNSAIPSLEKVHYLLNVLPKKETGFLVKFICCLWQTRNGTGHGDIASVLLVRYKEAIKSM